MLFDFLKIPISWEQSLLNSYSQLGISEHLRMLQNAQVAELVDALVSNTNAFGRAGSTPALGTSNKKACLVTSLFVVFHKEAPFVV